MTTGALQRLKPRDSRLRETFFGYSRELFDYLRASSHGICKEESPLHRTEATPSFF